MVLAGVCRIGVVPPECCRGVWYWQGTLLVFLMFFSGVPSFCCYLLMYTLTAPGAALC